jgi:DNA polymerase-3 subunit alpha
MTDRRISNLHGHSCFSFQDGICTPEEIIEAAKAKGLRSVALTDHGHAHGHGRFYLAGKKAGVRTLLGMEAYCINDFAEWHEFKDKVAEEKRAQKAAGKGVVPSIDPNEEPEGPVDKAALLKAMSKVLYRKGHLVLLAQNRTGLANIYRLQFKAHKHGYYQKPRIDKRMLAEHAEGIVASSACMGGILSQKIWGLERGELEWSDVVREAQEYAEIFPGRFFLELQSNEAAGQRYINEHLIRLSQETGLPLNVTMDAHYVDPEDWRSQQMLHMLMTHRGGKALTLNNLPEGYSFDVRSLFIKSGDELWESFRRLNPEVDETTLARAFDNTLYADSLISDFEPDTSMRLPSLPYEDTLAELRRSAAAGLVAKGLVTNDQYIERLKYELGVIKEKGIANYFLVVRNICDSARKEMRIGPGRGSSAGSLICYLTGITNIDPIEHKLMFERFINLDRVELPDIDLDFEDVDRIKDILRRDFGEDNVACLSAFGTSQIKGLMKDVCRVHGIDHQECNRTNALIEREMKALYSEGEGVTRSAITIKLDDVYRLSPSFNAFIEKYPQIERAIKSLYGREHHVSRHASGVVIGDDLPAETSVFTSKGVVQASFTDGIVGKTASSMGLVKFDILSLATLKVIAKALELIAERTGRTVSDVDREIDPKVMDFNNLDVLKKVFWEGNTTGIFSVTSAGMVKLFQRVKPTSFDDVAAVTALFRPGPLGSKMDVMFANRKNGLEEVTYDHPILESIMKDTYGCLVYQEQMLEIGRLMGKMSWKDTNRLRKLFLKKDKSKADGYIDEEERYLKSTLIKGVVENGLTEEHGEKLWEMCGKFGGYGFNRSHSYAYAMVTMQTAYLRYHYPLEFFAALLTVGQAVDLQTYVNEIRAQGFEVLPVDVNRSKAAHVMEGNAIRLALSSVKGIGPSAVQKIVDHQPYADWEAFLLDSTCSKTIVNALIGCGAFTELCPGLSVRTLDARHTHFRGDKKLSHKKNRDTVRPTLEAIWADADDPIELMERERELLGFNLRGTPFGINGRYDKVDRLVEQGICSRGWAEFVEDQSEPVLVAPLLVKSIKERAQKNGKLMAFLRLEDRDGNDYEAPAFGNVWGHVREHVRQGDVYVCILHRKEEEPDRFIVGRPGWAQTAKSAQQSFIPIDRLTV